MAQQSAAQGETDIFSEAPPAPKRGLRFFLWLVVILFLLVWSFQGAKIRPGELVEGIPQIFATVGRMLPPDFSKITDAKSYFFPEGISLTQLLSQARQLLQVDAGAGVVAVSASAVAGETRRIGVQNNTLGRSSTV